MCFSCHIRHLTKCPNWCRTWNICFHLIFSWKMLKPNFAFWDILMLLRCLNSQESWVRLRGPVIQANGRLTFEDDLRSGGLLCFNYTVNQRPHWACRQYPDQYSQTIWWSQIGLHGKTQYIPGKQVLVRSWLWKNLHFSLIKPKKFRVTFDFCCATSAWCTLETATQLITSRRKTIISAISQSLPKTRPIVNLCC